MLVASAAFAQGVDVAASLAVTDGWARPGAYVPVRLKVTNRTAETLREVRVSCGGPVDTVADWRLAPGESAEKDVPVFYVGGDLRLDLQFVADGGEAARVQTAPGQVRVASNTETVERLPMPAGADETVQPETCRLLATRAWPAGERQRLWLWLGLFSLAAVAVGVLVPRRRVVVVTATLTVLAAGTTAAIWCFGGVHRAGRCEARVFYANLALENVPWGMEHLVMLESRGGAAARFVLSRPGAAPLPLPVLEASEDLFRPAAVLHYGETARLESCAPRFLAHVLDRAGEVPFGVRPEAVNQEHLDLVARRADVLAALLIRDDRATDAAGRTQTIEAWATQWKASADADLAFIGRSFAWWDRCRREGDGPALLAWFRDPLPPDAADSQDRARLPALVVYGGE